MGGFLFLCKPEIEKLWMINDFIDYLKEIKILKEFTFMDWRILFFKIHEIQYMNHNMHYTNSTKIIRGYMGNFADL